MPSKITFADRIETDTAGAETGFINGSSTTPRIDLISRAVKINGTLQAEELNVVTVFCTHHRYSAGIHTAQSRNVKRQGWFCCCC